VGIAVSGQGGFSLKTLSAVSKDGVCGRMFPSFNKTLFTEAV
jgi:hypothetical protein